MGEAAVKLNSEIEELDEKLIAEYKGQIEAINKSQAVIEFNMDGTIINANENFLGAVGYSLSEIQGQHHKMFVEKEYALSAEYKEFWEKLNRGEFDSNEYKRVGNGGKEIWIQASYNPIKDLNGEPYKVVKYATDLTKEKLAYNNLVNSFELASEKVEKASMALSDSAKSMVSTSSDASNQSTSASAAAEQVASGISNLAANTEEMSSTINEISRTAKSSSTISEDAKQQTTEASMTMKELGEASVNIGQVIKIISSIAQQTNLLALNATIEAARAGEAGKGFAVVASEVKELAKQTASATEDIVDKIDEIQKASDLSVSSIEKISEVIEQLSSMSTTTAVAVEEQAATTSEVSRIVQESRVGMDSISENIKKVALGAQENSQSADSTLKASENLGELAAELKLLVENSR